jgi:hypothetical protein
MYPLEIEQGEVPDRKLSLESSRSTLPRPVQQLVTLIFDVGQCPSSVCGSGMSIPGSLKGGGGNLSAAAPKEYWIGWRGTRAL